MLGSYRFSITQYIVFLIVKLLGYLLQLLRLSPLLYTGVGDCIILIVTNSVIDDGIQLTIGPLRIYRSSI